MGSCMAACSCCGCSRASTSSRTRMSGSRLPRSCRSPSRPCSPSSRCLNLGETPVANRLHTLPWAMTPCHKCYEQGVSMLQGLLAGGSVSPEAAQLLKLGFKAFWSASYMEIPAPLAEPTMFAGWMTALHTFITQPVPEVCLRKVDHTLVVGYTCQLGEGSMACARRKVKNRCISIVKSAVHNFCLGSTQQQRCRMSAVVTLSTGPARGPGSAPAVALVEGDEVGAAHLPPPVQQVACVVSTSLAAIDYILKPNTSHAGLQLAQAGTQSLPVCHTCKFPTASAQWAASTGV